MGKYILSQGELRQHWKDQLDFIKLSMLAFDKGDEKEARRIATSLRVMFHDTSNSSSLISQINLKYNIKLWSSGTLYTPSNLFSSWSLLTMEFRDVSIFYRPIGSGIGRTFFLDFEDWWNEIIFDDKKDVFSRKDIVCYVANQDGGAHVDSSLKEKYAKLVKHNSLGWVNNDGRVINNNPAYNAIRQIATEVIVSQNVFNKGKYTRKKRKECKFEMRYFDDNRRFKWSTTEVNCSRETSEIVNKYRKEERILYLQEYFDKTKLEVVSKR